MNGAKCISTLMFFGNKLSLSQGEQFEDPSLCHSTIDALQYLTMTKPNISFFVNKLSQFLHAPTIDHWKACTKVVRYLHSTIGYSLHFKPAKCLFLEGFTDEDLANSLDDRRSTSGYCVYLCGNLIQWSLGKQKLVARSNIESKYKSLAQAAIKILWLQSLFHELEIKIASYHILSKILGQVH